mmetsp:Transcript_37825/g.100521  ORF Transcript_37825/g.100521 Transcript_37825/m.100521 type:complete len:271 (-) Transcript_37825:1548-2360(-)
MRRRRRRRSTTASTPKPRKTFWKRSTSRSHHRRIGKRKAHFLRWWRAAEQIIKPTKRSSCSRWQHSPVSNRPKNRMSSSFLRIRKLLLLRPRNQLPHRSHVPLHLFKLPPIVPSRIAPRLHNRSTSQQVRGDLILDEQLRQVLRQPDLLRQALARQPQQPLELRLDLHNKHGEQRARELHPPERARKVLLLGRQRLDRVAELLGRRDRLHVERDPEVVLVLDNHAVLGLELRRRLDRPHKHDKAAELPRLRTQERLRAPLPAEAVPQPRV